MDINISSIKNYEGKSIPIDCALEIEGRAGDDFEFAAPVKVNGVIRNFGGTIELDAKGVAGLKMVCDRCAEEFDYTAEFDIVESFKETERFSEENENPDIIYFSGDSINLDEHVYSGLVVSLPGKRLCREDCAGLCPKCGANLNDGPCGCDDRPTDPRFDILDDLDVPEK